jgi:sterol desaturase/sphingolipid hydroxylase (fatty acid hydroxylase superfamily)
MGKRMRDDGLIEYGGFFWMLALPHVVIPAILAGWLLGYALYEALHWLFHSGVSGLRRMRPIRRLWEAHTVHHLQQLSANYGFITVFWDRRFGTYQPLEVARLERK